MTSTTPTTVTLSDMLATLTIERDKIMQITDLFCKSQSPSLSAVIVKHALNVKPTLILPCLYAIDSILKNIPFYVPLFHDSILSIFKRAYSLINHVPINKIINSWPIFNLYLDLIPLIRRSHLSTRLQLLLSKSSNDVVLLQVSLFNLVASLH